MSRPGKESDALVLNSQDHGESDKIITFYTKDGGRFSGIAKGANRSMKRFVNKLELFTYLHLTYQEPRNKGLAFIQEAELFNSFLPIRQNYPLFCIASVIQEILLVSLDEKERDPKIFGLTLWALHALEQNRAPMAALQFFLARLYDLLGYRPNLSACLVCGLDTSEQLAFFFDYGAGGLVCQNCKNPDHTSLMPLSRGTIKVLDSAMQQPLERLHRLQLSGPLLNEAKMMLYRYGRVLFQRDLYSWKMIKGL